MSRRRVVVITGASAGVGRAAARAFANDGADVGLLARGPERLEAARREIEARGRRAVAIPTDVANPDQVEEAARAVERDLGPIDVWVNNATVTVMSPIAEMTPDEFRRVTEVTYLGAVHGTLCALRRMIPRREGVIVQVGSALAYRSIPLQSAYCASKHAIRGFTDSLRSELLHDGTNIHVTMVQLPAINTPQFEWSRTRFDRHPQPVPPIYQPEVAAEAIVFASHARRREIFVGARNAGLIWGNKVAPWLGDRYLAYRGYEEQFTDEPIGPDRPDNLFEPAPGDWAAHGPFDDRSASRSLQVWANEHRGALLAAAGVLALAAGMRVASAFRTPAATARLPQGREPSDGRRLADSRLSKGRTNRTEDDQWQARPPTS
jgi:NAD(P)-dependent dehydrogenase (short-subunit alcohol dehydrogenase family)